MTLYSILEVPEDADAGTIKKAYRDKAKANHPDTNPDSTPGKFAKISEAYEVLSDTSKRRSYDYTLSLERSQVRNDVNTSSSSEWQGFEEYANRAARRANRDRDNHGYYRESDMKRRERTARERAEDAAAAAAWWRKEKERSKINEVKFRTNAARAEAGRADRAGEKLKNVWAVKRGVNWYDLLLTVGCVGFVAVAGYGFAANANQKKINRK
tara:strand:+ start:36970 stop:37605 length:636 start_codon:yes stop_codon:yes gene_type:complete